MMIPEKCTTKDTPPKKRLKVMIFSGGGLRGYAIAKFMSYLNFDISKKVDVFSGTSIGGILAMTYAINPHYGFISNTFRKFGNKIFAKKWYWKLPVLRWWHKVFKCPKYDDANLKSMLYQFFGDRRLISIKNNFVIVVATNLSFECPQIFTNIQGPGIYGNEQSTLVNIGLYTAAAPIYFNAKSADIMTKMPKDMLEFFNLPKNTSFYWGDSIVIDGGLLENIPVISTYVTAHQKWNLQPEDIDVLIIGTGKEHAFSTYSLKRINSWGIFRWLFKVIKPYLTESNEQTSIYWGEQMGFHSFRFFNPLVINTVMDDPKVLDEIDAQCELHKNKFISVINDFINS